MNTIQYLNDLRAKKGYSIYELSMLSGVAKTTLYSAFERNNGASEKTIAAVAKVFGMELWELQKAISEKTKTEGVK